jgi:transcriptional regulator with XRE-family HTH domain
LSALSSIKQSDISKIEQAEANPTIDTLATLATPLGLTLALEPENRGFESRTGHPQSTFEPQVLLRVEGG